MTSEPVQTAPVAVLGLGIEGLDLVRFLRQQGAPVTAFDTRALPALADAAQEAEELGASVVLGALQPERAAEFSALYVSQSVLLHREPFVLRARELGLPVRSMISEFFGRWPGLIAGVTGSSGKTTTTALVAAAFASAGRAHIVGGNIGKGLLAQLDQGTPETWAVLELSHTQLQLLPRSPQVAAVTNVTPNHLDQFDWDAYIDLKRAIVRSQCAADIAVLNAADPICREFAGETAAETIWFGGEVPGERCCFATGGVLYFDDRVRKHRLITRDEVPLRGAHNVENVLAATAVAAAAGIELAAIAAAVRSFHAVPHRLEPVAKVRDVSYINDSIATSPERTLAGMRSFTEPLVLLLGGREKRLPLDDLAQLAHQRARAIICFGEAGGMLSARLQELAPAVGVTAAVLCRADLQDAVSAAADVAEAGDVVLLSPACTSFDAYPNFERRGEEFRRLVSALAAGAGVTPSDS